MTQPCWVLTEGGNQPLMAVALHDGHEVRPEVAELFAISESERLREADPFTASWTVIADTQLVVKRSRFEVDLNRPRKKAVYLKPEDAWGLTIWKQQPPPEVVQQSLAQYDAFYALIEQICTDLERRFGRFVIFDLHTYNHRRNGPDGSPANPTRNPEVNVGTGSMNRAYWAPVVERFLGDLRQFDFLGRQLDVRENIKFSGGHCPIWVHRRFPESACVLAVEFKKFFMDEWTHQPDPVQLDAIRRLLQSTVPGVLEALSHQRSSTCYSVNLRSTMSKSRSTPSSSPSLGKYPQR
jgi:N-formylglutamate deformylase